LLADELEAVVSPLLRDMSEQITALMKAQRGMDEAAESMAQHIADRVLESSHVDDIFAEDRTLHRQAYRVTRDLLLRYSAGELRVKGPGPNNTHTISLDELGYVVATVATHADEALIEGALLRAATATETTLAAVDYAARRATFEGDGTELLALEEALTEALTDLVRTDLVELPSVEQVLEVPRATAQHPRYRDALKIASGIAAERTSCLTACKMVDETTLLASLTPLSTGDARCAATHFATFIDAIEQALTQLDGPPESREQAIEERDDADATAPTSRSRYKKRKSGRPPPKRAEAATLLAAFPGAKR